MENNYTQQLDNSDAAAVASTVRPRPIIFTHWFCFKNSC